MKKANSSKIEEFTGEYEFLSNKSPSTFFYKGIKYKSVAHAYQSLKAKDEFDAKRIRELKTASEAIQEGRKVEVRGDWQETCRDLMEDLIYAKFATNIFIKPKLIATGNAELGDGRNFVGSILMKVRTRLINENRANS